jgi:hypothetical protein
MTRISCRKDFYQVDLPHTVLKDDIRHGREGVAYLRGVPGTPTLPAGPGRCERVSCSWELGIWWCNDVRLLFLPGSFVWLCVEVLCFEPQWLTFLFAEPTGEEVGQLRCHWHCCPDDNRSLYFGGENCHGSSGICGWLDCHLPGWPRMLDGVFTSGSFRDVRGSWERMS